MKKGLKFLLCLLLLVCCAGALTAGGQKEKTTTAAGLPRVELTMWLVGDSVPDYGLMLAELNKLMLADLNATLKVNFTTWTDWTTKLRLVLSSGETVDLVHMAPWSIYTEQAELKAFYDLETLAPKYAPVTWAGYSPAVLNQARVNGKVYMLPFNYVDPEGNGFLYRLDLAEKYGVGKITNIDKLAAYMQAVKEKEGILPYNAGGFDNQVMSESFAMWMGDWPNSADENLVVGQMNYIKVFHNDPEHPFVLFEHPSFKAALEYSRRFYQQGYWSKNVLANTTDSRDAMLNGTSAITNLNPINANEEYQRLMAKNPTWKLDWWSPYQRLTNPGKSPANNNGMSIPISSKNPERALMLLEKLHQDQRYAELTTYGIRGVHWDLDAQGDIVLPAGVTADTTGFPWDRPCPWGWREEKFYLSSPTKSKSTWPVIADWVKYIYAKGVDKKYADFKFNKDPVAAEMAAIDNVKTQYLDPLIWGMVDTKEGYQKLIDKMYQAGLQKIKDEFNKQWKAYLQAKKS